MSTLKLKVNLLIWIWRIWLSYQISFFVFHILIFKNMTSFETTFCLVLKKQKSKFNDYKRVSNLSKYIQHITMPFLHLVCSKNILLTIPDYHSNKTFSYYRKKYRTSRTFYWYVLQQVFYGMSLCFCYISNITSLKCSCVWNQNIW